MRSAFVIGLLLFATSQGKDVAQWQKNQNYKPGDLIESPYFKGRQMICKDAPFGDFCDISPMEHGGTTGWEDTRTASSSKEALPEVDCRESGYFTRGDLYCAAGSKYVWHCRNNENCNSLKPLDSKVASWKMWETWELISARPTNTVHRNSKGFEEPSESFLKNSFAQMPLEEGFTLLIEPMVLPVSLADFRKIFVETDDHFFFDEGLKQAGHTLMVTNQWQQLNEEDKHSEFTEIFNSRTKVEQHRLVKIMTQTPNPLLPYCYSDIDMMLYRDTPTEYAFATRSYAEDQYLSDSFKFWDNWEVITSSEDSQQVALRVSTYVDWVKRPWGLTGVIESAVNESAQVKKKNAEEWIPKTVNEWLSSQNIAQVQSIKKLPEPQEEKRNLKIKQHPKNATKLRKYSRLTTV